MKAYLIDPFKREITEVDHAGGIDSIYKLIEARMFDAVRFNDDDCVFVDDEGLYAERRALFTIHGYPQPLVNKGLVLGTDNHGESISPSVSLDWLKANVTFLDFARIPAGGITTFDENDTPHFESFGADFVVKSERDAE